MVLEDIDGGDNVGLSGSDDTKTQKDDTVLNEAVEVFSLLSVVGVIAGIHSRLSAFGFETVNLVGKILWLFYTCYEDSAMTPRHDEQCVHKMYQYHLMTFYN